MGAGRSSSVFLKMSASAMFAVGALFSLVELGTIPHHVELAAIGIGFIATGLAILLSTRLERSTTILSVLLLWSLVANLCLACRLGQASSFPGR